MRERLITGAVLTVLMLGLTARPARAQADPKVSAAGGYTYLQENGPADIAHTYKTGWMVTGAVHLWWRLYGVGEYGVSLRKNVFDETARLSAFLGGVRVPILRATRMVIYAQTLLGVERFSEPGFEESGLAIQPGAGLDWLLWSNVFVRAQGDYRWAQQTAGNFHEFRLFVGMGVNWGRVARSR